MENGDPTNDGDQITVNFVEWTTYNKLVNGEASSLHLSITHRIQSETEHETSV